MVRVLKTQTVYSIGYILFNLVQFEFLKKRRQSDPDFKELWDKQKKDNTISQKGSTWDEFEKEICTPEEIKCSHRRAIKGYKRELRRRRKRRRKLKEIYKRL